ncbi:unnamed protein product [Ceratitis capitata]|uniref:(Mediterranean fruit fly) hypothetical protein n=1 Tax=Ceratitis capitata TaxID=7213 RepID=A0A811VIL3_CERCA|nr:unnamed protein product [Ceratitis capitata]
MCRVTFNRREPQTTEEACENYESNFNTPQRVSQRTARREPKARVFHLPSHNVFVAFLFCFTPCRPLTAYYGKGKRESCVSSATTTTLLGHNQNLGVSANIPMTMQRGSNGALHMMPTVTTLSVMPRAISPLMKQGLEENSV